MVLSRKCSISACDKTHKAKGYCSYHYDRTPDRIARKAFSDKKRVGTKRKRASDKAWRINNPDKVRIQRKRFNKLHPDRLKAYSQKRRAETKEKIVRFGWIDEKLIANYYSKICGICDLKIESKYELDHIIPFSRK